MTEAEARETIRRYRCNPEYYDHSTGSPEHIFHLPNLSVAAFMVLHQDRALWDRPEGMSRDEFTNYDGRGWD